AGGPYSQTWGNLILGANTDDYVYSFDQTSPNVQTLTFNQFQPGANAHVYFFGYGYGGSRGGGDIGRSNQITSATIPALTNNISPNVTTMGNNFVSEQASYTAANGVIPLSIGAGYNGGAGPNGLVTNSGSISGLFSQSLLLTET